MQTLAFLGVSVLISATVFWTGGVQSDAVLLYPLLFLRTALRLGRRSVWLIVGVSLLGYLTVAAALAYGPSPVGQAWNALSLVGRSLFLLTLGLYLGEFVALTEEYRHTAMYDDLTGVYRRGYWLRRLLFEVDRTRRYGGALAVLMVDVDNFKAINDTYGHAAGDAVLVKVADVLRESIRLSDLVGRWGGEEFVLLLSQQTGATAAQVADRLRQLVQSSPVIVGRAGRAMPVGVSVSVGVAALTPGATTADDLLEAADQAMYRAKAAGNRVEVFTGVLRVDASEIAQ